MSVCLKSGQPPACLIAENEADLRLRLAGLTLSDEDPCAMPKEARILEGKSRRGQSHLYELVSPLATGGTDSGFLQSRFVYDLRFEDARTVRHPLLRRHASAITKYNLNPYFRDLTFGNLRPGNNAHLRGSPHKRHYEYMLLKDHVLVALSSFDIELDVLDHPEAGPAIAVNLDWDIAYVLRNFRGKGAGRCLAQAMAKLLTRQMLHVAQQLPTPSKAERPPAFLNVCATWASQSGLVLHGRLMAELELHRQAHLRAPSELPQLHWLPALELGCDYI